MYILSRGVGVRSFVNAIPIPYDYYTEKFDFKVLFDESDGRYVVFAEVDGHKPAFSIFSRQGMYGYKGYEPLGDSDKSDHVVLYRFRRNRHFI